MKAEIEKLWDYFMDLDVFTISLFDGGEKIAESSKVYTSLVQAREACRRYFPQFRLDGEEKTTLPDSFCVVNDGSDEFQFVLDWMNSNSDGNWIGTEVDWFYGRNHKGDCDFYPSPFGTVLTLEQFKEMAQSPTA